MVTAALERSRLLVGTVHHRRARHTEYAFTHSAWYVEADLDETQSSRTQGRLWLPAWLLGRVRARDHLNGRSERIADELRARLGARGVDATRWRIALVTYPRLLGPLFNPVSFYLCRDEQGMLRFVIAEVNNTHGGRALYDFPPTAASDPYRSTAVKRMYVSPFIDATARYELRVSDGADRLGIDIREYEGDELALYARMDVRRVPLTSGRVAAALIRQPVMSTKTVVLIAWHALRLRLRGVRWHRHRREAAAR